MKINEILKNKRTFSFEVFPPKLDKPLEPLFDILDKFEGYNPDFISVTYGSGGTNKGRNNEICIEILKRNITLMSHFVSIGNSREDVKSRVNKYVGMGAENILAMRGDLPKGWQTTGGAYTYGSQLIEDVSKEFPQLCVAGACYPEKHIEANSLEEDIAHMKTKEKCGAEFFVSQLCYSTDNYEIFLDKCQKQGINAPIILGLLPVLNRDGILKMATANGCSIPSELELIANKYSEKPEEFKKAGKEYTKELIGRYDKIGVEGIHIYTLNKFEELEEIIKDTGLI